jgi:hypothetical protein
LFVEEMAYGGGGGYGNGGYGNGGYGSNERDSNIFSKGINLLEGADSLAHRLTGTQHNHGHQQPGGYGGNGGYNQQVSFTSIRRLV